MTLATDTVERWLQDNYDLLKVNALVARDDNDGNPPEVWKAARELGWIATLVPEAHGGLGLGLSDAIGLVEALGRGVTPGPYLTQIIAADAIREAGSDEQQARLLPALAAGEAIAAVAGTDLEVLPVKAKNDRLTGDCGAVAFAHLARTLVVPVGYRMYVVDAKAPGVTIEPCASIDGTVRYGLVKLKDVPAERLERAAWPRIAERGAVLVAADLVGLASRALEITVEYVKLRKQFDKPIGANQGVKHPLADVYVATTMARKGLRYAAQKLDDTASAVNSTPDASVAAHVAKAKSNDAGREAAVAMIQFHGAIGFTAPHPAHLFFKRAKRQEYEFGSTIYHRDRVANHWIKTAPDRP